MGMPDKGMAFTSKIRPWENVPEEIEPLADHGTALQVQLLRLRSHRPLKDLLQRLSGVLMTLEPTRGSLQEVPTVMLHFNAVGGQ